MGANAANLAPFFEDGRSDDAKKAVASYISAVMQKQGHEIARQADLSGTQQGMAEMKKAFKLGQNMTEADLYDVNEAEVNARQALIDTGVFDIPEGADAPFLSDDTLGLSSYELFALSRDNRFNAEEKQALRNLALVRNAKEGLESKLKSYSNAAIAANDMISNGSAKDGVLTVGYYNNEKVYIKGGVQVANGSIVKPSDVSGHPVEIVNAMTGEATTVDSKEIYAVENFDLAEYNKGMADIINTSFEQRWDQWRNTKSAKSKLAEIEGLVGQSVYIDNGNGNDMTDVEIMQILPNGEVVLKGKKGDLGGQSTIRVDVDSLYDSMTRDSNGNPIFNQSKFRSQSANINSRRNALYNAIM